MNLTALAPLAVAAPMVVAAFLAGVGKLINRRVADVLAILTAAGVGILTWLLFMETVDGRVMHWFGGWEPRDGIAIGISFTVDQVGAGMATLTCLLVIAALVFSLRYFDTVHALYHSLMLVFLAALCGFSLTGDIFNLFVFFELMGAAAFVLCGYKSDEPGAIQGALNFGITNTIGAFLALTGIAMLYARTGALNLAQIGRTLDDHGVVDNLLIVAFALVLGGFFIKAAVVPFHFWLADAHAVAPTPVCVLFSGVMVEFGLFAVARVYWTVFEGVLSQYTEQLRAVLIGAGILTALVGAVMCFAQHHIKRLLAFSTISHIGLLVIAFALLEERATAGASIYVLGHATVKGALFLGAGMLLHRFATVEELDLKGFGRRIPLLAALFVLGGLALSAMPPFGTFLGETMIDEAAEKLHLSWLWAVFFAAGVLTGGAVLRVAGRVFMGWGAGKEEETPEDPKEKEKPETKGGHDHIPVAMALPAAVLLALGLLVTFLPDVRHHADVAAVQFHDHRGYIVEVLGGAQVELPPPEAEGPLLPGVIRGIGTTGGAVGLALLALFSTRRRRLSLPGGATVAGAVRGLRRSHSGRVGDYVTWMVAGIVGFGALFALLFQR
jgi:multicomponent Na+:H+ antiporter subunit D